MIVYQGLSSGKARWSRVGLRCMSIMDRYRKVRPVPAPASKPWDAPPEFAGRNDSTDVGIASFKDEDQSQNDFSFAPRRPPAYSRVPVPDEARLPSWEPPVQPVNPHSLQIGLVGPPNAGKSSLMNAILECPISAVSPKVNTTREGVRGIFTMGNTQLSFLDVPGIIPSHQRQEMRDLVSKAWRGYQECDLCLLVVDVVKRPTQEVFDMVRRLSPREGIGQSELRRRVQMVEQDGSVPAAWFPRMSNPAHDLNSDEPQSPPVALVLNKIDKAEEFRWIQSREREFRNHGYFDRIFYVSAKRNQGIDKVVRFLKSEARPRPWKYPPELKTTMSLVDQIEHQLNTHLFMWFNSDVPYKIQHQTVGWTPRLDGSLLIEHELIVQDSVVARMILGVRNTIVQRLKDQVSYKLKKLWGTPVELQIWVTPLKQRLSVRDRQEGRRLRR